MKIYIDNEYMCHTSNPDGLYREFDVPFFNNKRTEVVEGYRYIPPDEVFTHNGTDYIGEQVTPWKPYSELAALQHDFDLEKLADAENALSILYGGAS